MPVDTDEILIFKLRGIITGNKAQTAKNATVPAPESAAVPEPERAVAPAPAPKPMPIFTRAASAVKPAEAAVRGAEAAAKLKLAGIFARKPKPERKEEKVEPVQPQEEKTEKTQPYEEETKAIDVARLEAIAAEEYVPAEGMAAPEKQMPETINIFAILAGLLFIFNATLFSYFVYPQTAFVIGYIEKVGLANFLFSWNYDYGTAFVNLVLIVFTAASGLLTILRIRQSHFISGIVGAFTILAVTFEYLNSNATYLLVISVFSFMCIGVLAYSRMSAITATEKEEAPQEVTWPRIETF